MIEKEKMTELSEADLEEVTGGGYLQFGKIPSPTYIWHQCTNPSCGAASEWPPSYGDMRCAVCNGPTEIIYHCPQCGSILVYHTNSAISCYSCQTVTYDNGTVTHY
jgi:hypothetical protein